MSKIERLREETFLESIRYKDYKRTEQGLQGSWGSRERILDLGKPIDKVEFFRYGKSIASSRQQVQLMYGWIPASSDRRTRVIGKAWFQQPMGLVLTDVEDNPYIKDFWDEDPHEAYKEDYLKASPEKRKEIDEDPYREVIPLDKEPFYRQRFFPYDMALKIMKSITEGRMSQYLLTNPVYAKPYELKGHYGRRHIGRLTEMHVLYTEIDQYNIEKADKKYHHMTSQQVWRHVKRHLIENAFPLPTEVVFSRGLQLYWKHGPIPEYMIGEWRMMMAYIQRLLKPFGADPDALDPVRVLRAVGSVHEKTGKKITGMTYTHDRYDFMDVFQTYCSDEWNTYLHKQEEKRQERVKQLEERWQDKARWMVENGILDEYGVYTAKYDPTKKKKRTRINHKAQKHAYTNRHQNIVNGIFWLSNHVRKGYMDGSREFSCYLARTMVLRVTGGNTIEALRVMRELYDSFSSNEYDWDEMVYRTNSAELDYKRWSLNESNGVRYKTETLIKKLKIKPHEMKEMRFIVDENRGKELKKERDRLFYQERLKKEGKMTKQQEKQKRLQWIRGYLQKNPHATQQEMADELGVHKSTISRLMRESAIQK
ncbi:MAG: hypothetical protein ACQEWE_21605 [Bacillota bacterium]